MDDTYRPTTHLQTVLLKGSPVPILSRVMPATSCGFLPTRPVALSQRVRKVAFECRSGAIPQLIPKPRCVSAVQLAHEHSTICRRTLGAPYAVLNHNRFDFAPAYGHLAGLKAAILGSQLNVACSLNHTAPADAAGAQTGLVIPSNCPTGSIAGTRKRFGPGSGSLRPTNTETPETVCEVTLRAHPGGHWLCRKDFARVLRKADDPRQQGPAWPGRLVTALAPTRVLRPE
jgi:hypothetical protein